MQKLIHDVKKSPLFDLVSKNIVHKDVVNALQCAIDKW